VRFEPGEWLPIIIFTFIGGCTVAAMAGAWIVGRARGLQDAQKLQVRDGDTHQRLERMEQALVTISEEIERLGEIQRFALKTMADRGIHGESTAPRASLGRVITPH